MITDRDDGTGFDDCVLEIVTVMVRVVSASEANRANETTATKKTTGGTGAG
jgi:hypothetical protein